MSWYHVISRWHIDIPGEWMQPVVFYMIAVSLFPFAISPDPEFLRQIAPGVIWVAAPFLDNAGTRWPVSFRL